MHCLRDSDLENLAQGRTSTGALEHISTCQACAARLDAIRKNLALECELRGGHEPHTDAQAETLPMVRDAVADTVDAAIPTTPNRRGGADSTKSFSRYKILGELGRGGMGIVRRAYDPKLKREVALKVLIAGEDASKDEVERFFREAEAAAKLRHPNIVPIHELDIHEGTYYFTMDIVEGESLRAVLKKEQMKPERAMALMAKIAHAVGYAHSQGIVHRDIKPSNVVIRPDGEPVVMDFGLAKETKSDSDLTQSGVALGTPEYMSPEQAGYKAKQADARSDVFSLGIMLYEMLTWRLPFLGNSNLEVLNAICLEDPPAPHVVDPRIPRDAEVICLKCLEKDQNRRYESAEELAEDCRRFLTGEAIAARPASVLYRARKRMARHKGAAIVGLASVVALAGLVTWSYVRIVDERNHAIAAKERADKSAKAERLAKLDAQQKAAEAERARRVEQELRKQAEEALALRKRVEDAEAKLTLGRQAMANLLPSKIPSMDGFEFWPFFRSSMDVGGAYYDYLTIDDAQLAVILVETSTRSVEGVITTALLRSQVRLLLRQHEFGYERLADLVRENSPQRSRDLVRTLIRAIDGFRGNRAQARDYVLWTFCIPLPDGEVKAVPRTSALAAPGPGRGKGEEHF